jgi:hypothetical protein
MIKVYIIFIIYLLFFHFSCNIPISDKKNSTNALKKDIVEDVQNENVEFKTFMSLVPTVNLPIDIYCGMDNYIILDINDFNNSKKFLPNKPGLGIVGKLSNELDIFSIIYVTIGDINYPFLYVYNNKGIVLDSLYLHIGHCAGDDNIISSNRTIINSDFSINMIDTTKYIHFEDDELKVDSILITHRDFHYNNEGRYIIK